MSPITRALFYTPVLMSEKIYCATLSYRAPIAKTIHKKPQPLLRLFMYMQ